MASEMGKDSSKETHQIYLQRVSVWLGERDRKDFAGSIAVDDDGFIYVADVGNRRIQKLAP